MYTLNFTLKFIIIKLNRHAKVHEPQGQSEPFFEFLDLVTPEPIKSNGPKLRRAQCVSVMDS